MCECVNDLWVCDECVSDVCDEWCGECESDELLSYMWFIKQHTVYSNSDSNSYSLWWYLKISYQCR